MIEVNWLLFVIASLAVILTPGQDLMLVMSRSIAQGAAAGVATAAGVSTGLLLHTVLAALGTGAIVQASETLFFAMKIVGASYLVYLGLSLLRVRSADITATVSLGRSNRRLYWDGAFSNVANPKIAIFYFAFLPQFVSAQAANPTISILALGSCFAFLTFVIKAPVGYFSGRLSQWFIRKPVYLQMVCRISGIMLLAMGLKLVLEKR